MPRIVFFGSSDLSVAILDELELLKMLPLAVVTQPDRPQGRRAEVVATPVKEWALARDIIVIDNQAENAEEFYRNLSEIEADLYLTAAYGEYLPEKVLDLPKKGALNIHPSLLPKYRGASPVQTAIIEGETLSGVSLMLMSDKMDGGPVLAQREVIIPENITAGEMMELMEDESRYLIRTALPQYLAGKLEPRPQDESQASYSRTFTREDGRVDFSKSAVEIHNLIRGLSPWPGAFSYLDGRRVKLHSSLLTDEIPECEDLPPGSVFCRDERFFVVCGEGVLELLEIQFASKAQITCASCAHNYREGYRFESFPEKAVK
ncbi:MAG: methionyl-tRNA formyltransferase [Eubacteriales bacterium]|nr:methionyl-tRNA formyltransferase [Eubacteriales bacterium]